jgi:hypothetical protein
LWFVYSYKSPNKRVTTFFENGIELGRLLFTSYTHRFAKGQTLQIAGTIRRVISEKLEKGAYSVELSSPKKFKTKKAYLLAIKEM